MYLDQYMPVRLITGRGCVRASAKQLAQFGGSCLIVTGRHAAKACGALADVTDTLEANAQHYTVFDAIGENPKLSDCMAAAQAAQAAGAEFIIGIGGGSALDAAKCIAVLAANPGMTREQLYAFDWANAPLKTVLVGTTAGTGSEVTKVSVITTPDGRKKSFHHEAIFASLALGDPCYTMTLPEMTTRSTAVDVLAHCAESYFARNANNISQCYAVQGIRLLLPVFRLIAEKGCAALGYAEREALYCASIYGGLAINVTGTAFPHTVGYLLTEQFSVPHGTACAVFHEAFYYHNKAAAPELTEHFLTELGCTEEEYLSLLRAVTPPCDISIPAETVSTAHSRWENNASVKKCLGELTAEDIDRIIAQRFPG